ncbi:MAG TPA: hypothetical protein VMM93_04315 [Vicinamibacterales bacterium]|nr:hypothetical protein [Vicinamibacterales bacterium]
MSPGELRERVIAARNADGGWPYYPGRQSRIEPTAWAAIALGATGSIEPFREGVTAFLSARTRQQGLLVDPGAPAANAGWNGLAVIALHAMQSDVATAAGIRAALTGLKGIALRPDDNIRQDNALQAWPWVQGTFSWVEPTAYCTLALKQGNLRADDPAVASRLAEADRLLVDRACRPAGWNYGNSAVLGQELEPYVPTTALALLALQDRPGEQVVRAGLGWLEEQAASEPATMALGLAASCLTVFGRPADKAIEGLAVLEQQTGHLDNAHLLSIALFARTLGEHGARALRI